MICERAIGQVSEGDLGVDWIDIDWRQTLRRAQRLVSRAGRRVDVLLRPGDRLRHGDMLLADPAVAIHVRETEVLRIEPGTVGIALRVALELGNQHIPAEVLDGVLYALDDGPVQEILDRLDLPFRRVMHRFHPLWIDVAAYMK